MEKKVLDFWFGRTRTPRFRKFWFEKNPAIDRRIRQRFTKTLDAASKGNLAQWTTTVRGRLALIIVLDQFSRNIYRGEKKSFASDVKALKLCKEGIRRREHLQLHPIERIFFFLPLMHSEQKTDQKRSVALFRTLHMEENLWYAKEHKRVIDLFGRFPHRNAILGRRSTKKELEYLAKPGAGF